MSLSMLHTHDSVLLYHSTVLGMGLPQTIVVVKDHVGRAIKYIKFFSEAYLFKKK